MCIIFVAIDAHPRFPLIVASNRDEFLSRPTDPLWGPRMTRITKSTSSRQSVFTVLSAITTLSISYISTHRVGVRFSRAGHFYRFRADFAISVTFTILHRIVWAVTFTVLPY